MKHILILKRISRLWLVVPFANMIVLLAIGCSNKTDNKIADQDCTYLKTRINELIQSSKNEEALQTLDSLYDCDTTSGWYIETRGILLSKLGRYSDANVYLTQSLAKGSPSPATYYWAGKCNEVLKDTVTAIRYYTLVPAGDSLYPTALNNLGEIYRAQRKFDLALREFRTAISIIPHFTFALNNMAHTYSLKGEYDSAYAIYSRGLRISQQDYLYYGRAIVKYKMGEYNRAICDFDSAIAVNPNNELAYLYRGYSYFSIDRKDLMCEDLATAMRLGNMEAAKIFRLNCSDTEI